MVLQLAVLSASLGTHPHVSFWFFAVQGSFASLVVVLLSCEASHVCRASVIFHRAAAMILHVRFSSQCLRSTGQSCILARGVSRAAYSLPRTRAASPRTVHVTFVFPACHAVQSSIAFSVACFVVLRDVTRALRESCFPP